MGTSVKLMQVPVASFQWRRHALCQSSCETLIKQIRSVSKTMAETLIVFVTEPSKNRTTTHNDAAVEIGRHT